MKFKIVLVNLALILVLFELCSRYIITNERLMDSFYGNTTKMWLTFWQNKPLNNPDLYSTKYTFDKELGRTLDKNLNDFYDNDSSIFITNNFGIRSDKEYSLTKKDTSIYRIATIGDSYTEGAEVANHQTWSYYVGEKLGENVEVLNFGTGGYGHDQCLIKLKRDVLNYSPDLVLLGFVNPDINRNVVAFRDFAKPMYKINNIGFLELENSHVKSVDFYKKNNVLKIQPLINLFLNNDTLTSQVYQNTLCSMIINEMAIVCKNEGISFEIVFIPTPIELNYKSNFKCNAFVSQISKSKKISFIDCLPAFNKTELLKKEGHWDAKGNIIISNCIVNHLKL